MPRCIAFVLLLLLDLSPTACAVDIEDYQEWRDNAGSLLEKSAKLVGWNYVDDKVLLERSDGKRVSLEVLQLGPRSQWLAEHLKRQGQEKGIIKSDEEIKALLELSANIDLKNARIDERVLKSTRAKLTGKQLTTFDESVRTLTDLVDLYLADPNSVKNVCLPASDVFEINIIVYGSQYGSRCYLVDGKAVTLHEIWNAARAMFEER